MIEPERQYAIRHSRVSQKRRDLERKVADQMRQELDHARIETTLKRYARDERDAFSNREDGTDAAQRSQTNE